MIIRLGRNKPSTTFQIGSSCGATATCGDWKIVITKKVCNPVQKWEYVPCGCSFKQVMVPQEPPVRIEYPMWKLEGDGGVTFLWDDSLWDLPRGRYNGDLMYCGEVVACIKIDLHYDKTEVIGVIDNLDCFKCGDLEC